VNEGPAIVSVAPRFVSVPLAATLKVAVPLPVPLVADVHDTHCASSLTDHAALSHPDGKVNEIDPVPPVRVNGAGVAAVTNISGAHALCVTVTDWPAMVSVVDRAELAAPTEYPALAEPDDDEPEVIVATWVSLEIAFQAQPIAVLTAIVPEPPDSGRRTAL